MSGDTFSPGGVARVAVRSRDCDVHRAAKVGEVERPQFRGCRVTETLAGSEQGEVGLRAASLAGAQPMVRAVNVLAPQTVASESELLRLPYVE